MDALAAVFVTIGLLCTFLFWPAGIALLVIGLLLYILPAIKPELHRQPGCPACGGPLGDDEPQICAHCKTKLYWSHEGDPLTREQFQAYAHRKRVWARERAQSAQSVGERADQAARAVVAWIVRPFVRH